MFEFESALIIPAITAGGFAVGLGLVTLSSIKIASERSRTAGASESHSAYVQRELGLSKPKPAAGPDEDLFKEHRPGGRFWADPKSGLPNGYLFVSPESAEIH